MATLDEEFAAMQAAQEPSLEQEFASMQAASAAPVEEVEPPEPPTPEELEDQRKAAEAEEARKTFIERYGPSVAAGLQAFATTTLPFVGSKIEEFAGLPTEKVTAEGVKVFPQAELREEHPVATGIGTVGGLAAGLIATGGLGGAAEAAGLGAAEAAAMAGAGRLGQAAAAAKAAGSVARISKEAGVTTSLGKSVATSVLSPVSAAARLGAATKAGVTALAPAFAATRTGKVAASVAAAAAEGAALSAALEADEARIQGREMSGQAILNGALISGGLAGVLSGVPAAVSTFGQTSAGREAIKRLGDSAAVRVLKRFGATEGEIRRAKQQIGESRYFSVLNDAERLGIVKPGMSIEKSGELAESLLKESGEAIGQFVDEAALRAKKAEQLSVRTDDVLERVSDEIVKKMSANVEGQNVANAIAKRLDTIRENYGPRMSVKNLSKIRSEISDTIYGLRGIKDPERTLESSALRDMRHILTDEIGNGLEKAGIDPKAWRVAQRQYEVASRIDDLAESAAIRQEAAKPIVEQLSALASMTGLKLAAKPFVMAKTAILDWAPNALKRALESGAPEPMVKDLQKLAELNAKQLEETGEAAKIAAAAIKSPQEAARRQYLALYNDIDNALLSFSENPEMASGEFSQYKKALERSKKMMVDVYYGKLPPGTKLFHPAAASQDFVKNAPAVLEAVDQTLTPYSRLGVGRTLQHTDAVNKVAAARDRVRNALANTPVWGAEYNKAAIDRMKKAAATLVDPDRVDALIALEELTQELQSKSTQKSSELMGLGKKTVRRVAETERGRETIKKPLRAVIEMSGFAGGPKKTEFGAIEIEPEAEAE